MTDKDRDKNLTELLLSVKIRLRDVAFLGGVISVAFIIVSILSELAKSLISPYTTRLQIEPWLRLSDYVENYEKVYDGSKYHQFEITMATHGSQIKVGLVRRGGPVQISSSTEFDPEKLALILANDRVRRDLQTQIEAVSTNVPGWSSFVDTGGQPCAIDEMRGIGFEYRIYPDNLSQHDFMNALLHIDRAINYSQERVDALAENLENQT